MHYYNSVPDLRSDFDTSIDHGCVEAVHILQYRVYESLCLAAISWPGYNNTWMYGGSALLASQ